MMQAVAGMDAIAAAIAEGAAPPAYLLPERFYRDGEVPDDTPPQVVLERREPWGYYLLGSVQDDPGGFYGRPGDSAEYRVHCWADTAGNALRLALWLQELLHGSRLPLSGYTVWQARARVLPGGRDATSEARQSIVAVEMEAVEA